MVLSGILQARKRAKLKGCASALEGDSVGYFVVQRGTPGTLGLFLLVLDGDFPGSQCDARVLRG